MAKLQVGVDELHERVVLRIIVLVLLVHLVVSPASPAFVVLDVVVLARPRFMYVGQGKSDLTVQSLRRGSERGRTYRIRVLEAMPREALLSVLVVKQIYETIGRVSWRVALPSRRKLRFEVSLDPLHQHIGVLRHWGGADRAPIVLEPEVVSQHDAVTISNRADFVVAMGIKGHDGETVPRRAIGDLLFVVLDDRRTSLERGGEHHNHRRDHVVRLLGILVRDEELTAAVHQHVVELGLYLGAGRNSQIVANLREPRAERALPPALVDPNPALPDLAAIANGFVEQRLVPAAVTRGTGGSA